jgi:polyphosphate kinase 2 (PPK2 family)
MFEFADPQPRVSKPAYRRAERTLRARLLDAQYDLKQDGSFAVLILIAGVDGAGKGETVHLLNEWMDPRCVATHGFADPSDEERERPDQFGPARAPRREAGTENARPQELFISRAYAEINDFEAALAGHGIVLAKFWLAIGKELPRAARACWR